MKIYKTKKIQQLHSFRHHNQKNQNCVQYVHVHRLNESGAKRKTTITLKLKQVCATHSDGHESKPAISILAIVEKSNKLLNFAILPHILFMF